MPCHRTILLPAHFVKLSVGATNIIQHESFKDNNFSFVCKCSLVSLWSSSCFSPVQQTEFSTLCGKFKRYLQNCVVEVVFFPHAQFPFFIIYNSEERPSGTVGLVFSITLVTIVVFCFISIRKNTLLPSYLFTCLFASFFTY